MNWFYTLFIGFSLFFGNQALLCAQTWDVPTIDWYNDIRIRIADKTKNESIELMEIIQAKNIFIYYKNHENFKQTDNNSNNSLEKSELMNAFQEEEKYLAEYWQKQLNKLVKTYSLEQLNNIEYLKRNTGLLNQLVQNSLWMRKNDKLVERIFEDENWLEKHKIIVRTLSDNIHYFTTNPQKALNWYKHPAMRQGSKNFMILRQLHIRFLNTNQKFKKTI